MLFEWTHMPIAQQVYAQIALSVQFRQPPRDLQALTDRIRGVYGKAGFLEKGMNRSEVLSLLGTPTSEEQGVLRYVFQRQHDQPPGSEVEEITWAIPLQYDQFVGLSPDWEQTRYLPPEPNSVQWILAKLEVPLEEDEDALEDDEDASDSVPRARDDELQALLDRTIELLPEASGHHWWMLCDAARRLADRSVKDPRVLQIVLRRYLDPQLDAGQATLVLRQYDPDGTPDLIAQRLRLEMEWAASRKP